MGVMAPQEPAMRDLLVGRCPVPRRRGDILGRPRRAGRARRWRILI